MPIQSGAGRQMGVSVVVNLEDLKTVPTAAVVVKHWVTIIADPKDTKRCLCVDPGLAIQGNYSQETKAGPGEWVVWENKVGKDVKLTFDTESGRLFGVETAVVYHLGDPLALQVREDAVTEKPHPYTVSPVDTMQASAGPVIIVPPPPGG